MDSVTIPTKYKTFFRMFFYLGIIYSAIIWTIVIWIWKKRHHRANPVGMMFNILIIQGANTFRIFLAGLLYMIW